MRSAFVLALLPIASIATGQIYLSGVVSFGANASGGSVTEPAEYDNIIGTNNSEVILNNTPRGTVHLLNDGPNLFTFRGVGGGYNAMSFYFGADSSPFSRPFASIPDLAVFGSNTPQTPIAGAAVQTNGQFSGTTPYSGASEFVVGDRRVVVTAWTYSQGAGSFELSVIPAPASLAALALAGLAATRRRR